MGLMVCVCVFLLKKKHNNKHHPAWIESVNLAMKMVEHNISKPFCRITVGLVGSIVVLAVLFLQRITKHRATGRWKRTVWTSFQNTINAYLQAPAEYVAICKFLLSHKNNFLSRLNRFMWCSSVSSTSSLGLFQESKTSFVIVLWRTFPCLYSRSNGLTQPGTFKSPCGHQLARQCFSWAGFYIPLINQDNFN